VPGGDDRTLVVASANVHAGVRRTGEPFDVTAAALRFDADVTVLQEVWWPRDEASPVAPLAAAVGGWWTWVPGGSGTRWQPGDRRGRGGLGASPVWLDNPADADSPIGASCRRSDRTGGRRAPGGRRPPAGRPAVSAAQQPRPSGPRGVIGTAVVGRLPLLGRRVVTLPPLRRDRARRSVLVLTVAVGGRPVILAATHMAHLSQGSLRHFGLVRRCLQPGGWDDRFPAVPQETPGGKWPGGLELGTDLDRSAGPSALLAGMSGGMAGRPAGAVLVGDFNLWGATMGWVLPGWRRAVVGRTWPAEWPVVQPDHILVRGALEVVHGEVLVPTGSDHRPVRAVLRAVG